MSLEVEMKYQLENIEPFVAKINQLDFKPKGNSKQADTYYQHPVKDYAQTDEALRIRQCNQDIMLTYKGPVLDKIAKTRKEIEIPLALKSENISQVREFVEHLGFRKVFTVEKERSTYTGTFESSPVEIVIDIVTDLGVYVEIETIVEEEQKDAARELLLRLSSQLGLEKMERRSYLRLLLEKQA